jgi:hypothetical protein
LGGEAPSWPDNIAGGADVVSLSGCTRSMRVPSRGLHTSPRSNDIPQLRLRRRTMHAGFRGAGYGGHVGERIGVARRSDQIGQRLRQRRSDVRILAQPKGADRYRYSPNRGPVWPSIFTVWLSCSIFSGFFNTVTGLICKIRSRTSESGYPVMTITLRSASICLALR